MGFKSTTKSNSSQYQVNNLIFPSRHVFSIIKRINRKLKFFYSPAPPDSWWPTIKYSTVRDNEEEFNAILDIVEKLIDRFNEKVEIIKIDDEAFNKEFLGIVDFLYEASDFLNNIEDELSNRTPENIKKKIYFYCR